MLNKSLYLRTVIVAMGFVLIAVSSTLAQDASRETDLIAACRNRRETPRCRESHRLQEAGDSRFRAPWCRIWPACFPIRNCPPGRGSPWKRFPDPKPMTPCGKRPNRSTACFWSARSTPSASGGIARPLNFWQQNLKTRMPKSPPPLRWPWAASATRGPRIRCANVLATNSPKVRSAVG